MSVFVFIFGSVLGSFLNVVIARVPVNESVVSPRSHCPKCKNVIRYYDNIPIISYLMLMGKCRHCKTHISIQYPVVELVTAIFWVVLFYQFGFTLDFWIIGFLVSSFVAIAVIDFHHYIIPDSISLPGIPLGFIYSFFTERLTWQDSLIGIVLGFSVFWVVAEIYFRLTKTEGLGGGDIKLLAMIGAFLGWKSVFLTIMISSALGSILGMSYVLFKKRDTKFAIPYGPFIITAAIICIFWEEAILNWYLGIY